MPGYTDTSPRSSSGKSAGRIDQGAVVTPCGHDRPEENTTSGTPRPMEKPKNQYTATDFAPSMDRSSADTSSTENAGSYAKRFA